MKCQIDYSVDGQRVHATVDAKSSIDALLMILATLPQTAAVKAVVKVLQPAETVQ